MAESEVKLSELKSRAQLLKPCIRLGKGGMTPEFMAAFQDCLRRSQLIKLKFDEFKEERKELSRQLAEQTGSRLVQQVGHTAVFYRASSEAQN